MRSTILLCLALVSFAANAADSARARLDAFAKGITSISADFIQQVFDPNGSAGKGSSGTLALKAPRRCKQRARPVLRPSRGPKARGRA